MRGSTSRRSRSIRWDFPSFSEGLSLRVPRSGGMSECLSYFPSFSEGLSLRAHSTRAGRVKHFTFPFLFGRAFIEARKPAGSQLSGQFPFLLGRAFIEARRSAIISLSATANFPFFLEGLSLRLDRVAVIVRQRRDFPSFFGRGFIEARLCMPPWQPTSSFPSFWEGLSLRPTVPRPGRSVSAPDFPSFSGGLSLRRLRHPHYSC